MIEINTAQIVQLCPVPPGYGMSKGKGTTHVIALALCEITCRFDADGDWQVVRDIFPVTCGYNGETDLLQVATPPKTVDLHYELNGLGDEIERPSIGPIDSVDPSESGWA